MKHLLVSLAFLLLPLAAWAQYADLPESDYSLWIQGNAVTDNNKANILGGETSTVSYDPETNVLTLDNATITGATYTKGCILSGRSELIISINGANTIESEDTCTAIIAVGTGEQALTIVKGSDDCSLSFNVSRSIRSFSSLTLTGLDWNDSYTYEWDTTLQGFEYGYRLMQSEGVEAAKTVNPETYEVESMPVLTDMVQYGLSVGGIDVTSINASNIFGDDFATAVYDAATNTLTLNNATIAPEGEFPGISYDDEPELTIYLIGSNTMHTDYGCEGIRSGIGSIVFATDENDPGRLTYTGDVSLFPDFEDSDMSVIYLNGLGLSTTAEGEMIGVFENYGLWVMGNRVTSVNKENILGDGNASVRFNPQTNTLSLYGALLGDAEENDTIFSSSLPSLTVDLHGNNVIRFSLAGFKSRITANIVPLTFTTNDADPGQLSWETSESGAFAEGFDVTYSSPLALQPSGNLISSTEIVNYGLTIGTTTVTNVNCTDVLGNGTVKYVDDGHVLVLDDAYIYNRTITSNLVGGLTIYLLGDNNIEGSENLITTSVENAPIVFTTSETTPGSLTLTKTEDEGTWITGFTTANVPDDYATTTDGNTMTIARPVPITPIVAETENGEKPETEKPTEEFGWMTSGEDPDTYLSIVINNVLYTLKPGDFNEDVWDSFDMPSGVDLTVVPDDMDDVLTKTPGSDAYAEAFKGLTIEVPEGNGQIMVKGEIGTNAQLGVKIGDNVPVLFPNEDYPDYNVLETLCIPYSCSKPTFVYIYLAGVTPSSSARSEVPWRGRVLTGHITIGSVGATSSLVVNNNSYSASTNTISNRVIAYELPASATTADQRGVVMSTVPVGSSSSALARGVHRESEQQQTITELGATVFDCLDKDQILYIDLSGTAVSEMTVNRSAGLFEGFGQNTLVYLPAHNDDGGEDNVILHGNCARLNLTDAMDFRAHKDFTAASAVLDREFTAGETSTLFLPFALTKDQADGLGTFHTFKEIQGANAVFNEAETDGTAANVPYIFLPSATKIEAVNVSVEGMDDYQVVSGNMVGTYEKLTWADEQTEIFGFAASDIGDVVAGEFVRVGAGAWLPPFRAFMQVSESTPSRLNIVVGGVTTALQTPNSQLLTPSSAWYNVNGQRISGTPSAKGLYINNKKKMIVR